MPQKRHESGTKKLREQARKEKKLEKLAKRHARAKASIHMVADNRGS